MAANTIATSLTNIEIIFPHIVLNWTHYAHILTGIQFQSVNMRHIQFPWLLPDQNPGSMSDH